jgi:hypothetical protein
VGDILLLEPGDVVAADGVYISGSGLQCDESAATGESDTIKKSTDGDSFLISGSKVILYSLFGQFGCLFSLICIYLFYIGHRRRRKIRSHGSRPKQFLWKNANGLAYIIAITRIKLTTFCYSFTN